MSETAIGKMCNKSNTRFTWNSLLHFFLIYAKNDWKELKCGEGTVRDLIYKYCFPLSPSLNFHPWMAFFTGSKKWQFNWATSELCGGQGNTVQLTWNNLLLLFCSGVRRTDFCIPIAVLLCREFLHCSHSSLLRNMLLPLNDFISMLHMISCQD
jgi:hypothetical protein